MRLATLNAINVRGEDNFPPVWMKRVKDWMSQWTVANNYGPVPIDDTSLPALQAWRDQLLRQVHQHFDSILPSYMKDTFDPAVAFEFVYYVSEDLEVGKAFSPLHRRHGIDVDRIPVTAKQ